MAPRAQSRPKAAATVARQLERYREMRDFQITPEPKGTPRGTAAKMGRHAAHTAQTLPFVIQKHAATRLHYDFRLGWRGVLKSWAVTKGPSYYPGDKRLAVEVEDHPMEYGGFEGTIPKGQYGGGAVMVWDYGEWKPLGDVDRGLAAGHLKFELKGKKLKGRWALVRMHGRDDRMHGHSERAGKPHWLLIKDRDEHARTPDAPCITEQAPESALTNRTIEQIGANADSVWGSAHGFRSAAAVNAEDSTALAPKPKGRGAGSASKASAKASASASRSMSRLLGSAPREHFPGFIAPQLAQQATKAPSGSGWVHELKLDGYRIQIHLRAGQRDVKHGAKSGRLAALFTRKGLDWTARMPDIAAAAAQLPEEAAIETAILDGEVAALNQQGIASFADLQAAFQEDRQKYLTYFAFDLLHLNGRNTRELPLLDRKKLLANLLSAVGAESPLRLSEHFEAQGDEVFRKACALGAEGIVSKMATAKYLSGRGGAWLKIKCIQEQELVIGGFTPPSKGGHGIGALLLGYYRDGKLMYAGRAGTGFTERTQHMLRTQLDKLRQVEPPFVEIPREARRDARWVKAHWIRPKLVAQVAFSNWTRDNLVRQAAFKGLREDKPANKVAREMPIDAQVDAPPKATSRGAGRTFPSSQVPARSAKHARAKSAGSRSMIPVGISPGISLNITHPEKVLDEESGMTKQTLAEYYLAVAERMLPQVANRPLSVLRCPEGSGKPCFFQKHVGRGLPRGVNSIAVPNRTTGEVEQYLTLDSAEGLAGLAQMGVLEIHPWGSSNGSLDKPDRLVFDLDPDAAIAWKILAASAEKLRARLKKLHLESFLKSTGGKGLHVVTPVLPEMEWGPVKEFAHALVLEMEQEDPQLYITKMTKAARTGKIYLDYLRNDRGSTSVAAFSPRARGGAPVAMTLDWKELRAEQMPHFHVTDLPQWRARLKRDPWKKMATVRQRLTAEALEAVGAAESARPSRARRR